MSFVDGVKKEIFSKNIKDKHCKIAFMAGLVRGASSLYDNDGEIGLEIKLSTEEQAQYVTEYLRTLFDYEVREASVAEDRLNKKDKFIINITGEKLYDILLQLDVVTEVDGELELNFKFYGRLTEKECCLRAFIRGLFVSAGHLSIPSDGKSGSGYHLELAFAHYTPALETSEKLAEFGAMPKIIMRRGSYIVYFKSAEEVKDFLAFLPAPISVLKLTDLMISREIANTSNRQKNCDIANVNKQVEAAGKQIDAILRIEQVIGLEGLKPDDRKVAVARKEYPDDTLTELAERLNITKSCLNHRLRKLINIANEL